MGCAVFKRIIVLAPAGHGNGMGLRTPDFSYTEAGDVGIRSIRRLFGTVEKSSDWIGYIVNGVTAPISMFPYMALIAGKKLNHVHCGGAVVSDRVVVTAAHCLLDRRKKLFPPGYFVVYLGSSKPLEGDKYDVCATIPYHLYGVKSKFAVSHDIGLILLSKQIKFGHNVKKALIPPNRGWTAEGTWLSVIGFGRTSSSGGMPNNLQMTRMKYTDHETCHKSQSGFKNPLIPPHMFCMSNKYWSSDCYGDSGSPVVWKKYVVGLVSAGRGNFCGSDMMPSMYTEIQYFEKWIKSNINKLEAKKCKASLKAKKKMIKILELRVTFNH